MPLAKSPLPAGLLLSGQLNRAGHPQLGPVTGEPTVDAARPQWDAVGREAYAALIIAGLCPGGCVRLGAEAALFLYGRAKHAREKDCDVIGSTTTPEYYLGEGKGADIGKAVQQLEAVAQQLAKHAQKGPVAGSYVVMPRLRYLEWNTTKSQWMAYTDGVVEEHITNRVQDPINNTNPPFLRDRIYLLDQPDTLKDQNSLPTWCIQQGSPRYEIGVHDRSAGAAVSPLRVGNGNVYIIYVQS
jgi:hypothetical protein